MATMVQRPLPRRPSRPVQQLSLVDQLSVASLWLAVIVNTTMWLATPILYQQLLPPILINEMSVFAALPAALLGCLAYLRFGGFAKSGAVVLPVILMSIAMIWTEPTEIHRGLSAMATFAESLPIAALVTKYDYQRRLSILFIAATAAADMFAALNPAIGLRYGVIYTGGIPIANSDAVSIQSAFAIILLIIVVSGWDGGKWLRNLIGVLVLPLIGAMAACGSRTAVLGLVGALLYGFVKSLGKNAPTALLVAAVVLIPIPVSVLTAEAGFSGSISELPIFSSAYGTFDEHFTGRTEIYSTAAEIVLGEFNWLGGVGPGGVSERLGREVSLDYRERDPDGIMRAYAHSTYIWVVIGLGLLGVLAGFLLLSSMFIQAFLMDRVEGGWKRVALVTFITIAAFGVVFSTEFYWNIVSALLWSLLTSREKGRSHRQLPTAPNLVRP